MPAQFSIVVFTVLAATSFCRVAQAQAADLRYCPMAVEGANWVIFDNEGFYAPVGYDGNYVIRIAGDSVHNGTHYKKMWAANIINEGLQRPSDLQPPYLFDSLRLYGLVRDDTLHRRFLGIVPGHVGSTEEEVLIHDFGIAVGDPMLGVYKFDTVLLENIIVDTDYGKVRRAQVTQRKDVVTIEGIGTSNTGPLCQNPQLALNAGFRSLIDYCVGSLEYCQLDIVSSGKPPVTPGGKEFSVYPNPVNGYGRLIINVQQLPRGDISCIDATGSILFTKRLHTGENRITLNSLSPGMYTLYYRGVAKKLIVR